MNEICKGEYDNTPFGIIEGADILTIQDLTDLSALGTELKETFKKSQMFRTRTEMEVSVLNNFKFPTASSKYWQSIREQNVMFNELVMLSYDYRKMLIEIKKHKRELVKEEDDLEKELIEMEIDKKSFLLKRMEKVAHERIREIKHWSEIKEREKKLMDKEEFEKVDTHQLVSYTKRWIFQSMCMRGNESLPEKQNLMGQLNSGIKTCITRGCIEEVLKDFNKDVQDKIREEYKIK